MKFNSNVYDVLKRIAQIYLPAAGTLYFAIAGIWNLPAAEQVTGTVVAVDTFLGILLGISSATYASSGAKYSGTFVLEPGETGLTLRLKDVDSEALTTKDEVTFKVVSPPPTTT